MRSCLGCKEKLTRKVQIEIVPFPRSPAQRVHSEGRDTATQAAACGVENL